MKGLCIKEPWASMILSGVKTLETRTRRTNFRGDFILCVSKKPESHLSGKAVAVVTLKDCRPGTPEDEKAACCSTEGLYVWELCNVRLIKSFYVRGMLGFFEIHKRCEICIHGYGYSLKCEKCNEFSEYEFFIKQRMVCDAEKNQKVFQATEL